MKYKNRENRRYPVDERNGYVRHRYAGEFGDKQSNHEFKRLHFAYLSFAHKSHNDEQNYKRQRRTDKNYYHTRIMVNRL